MTRPVTLPPMPWEKVEAKPAEPERGGLNAREYMLKRAYERREKVKAMIEDGKTRSEIKSALRGMTNYQLEKDIHVLGIKPKSERGTK